MSTTSTSGSSRRATPSSCRPSAWSLGASRTAVGLRGPFFQAQVPEEVVAMLRDAAAGEPAAPARTAVSSGVSSRYRPGDPLSVA